PCALEPQQATAPVSSSAQLESLPAPTSVARAGSFTFDAPSRGSTSGGGEGLLILAFTRADEESIAPFLPLPSWPWPLKPQQVTAPDLSSAHACAAPVETATAFETLATVTGALLNFAVSVDM